MTYTIGELNQMTVELKKQIAAQILTLSNLLKKKDSRITNLLSEEIAALKPILESQYVQTNPFSLSNIVWQKTKDFGDIQRSINLRKKVENAFYVSLISQVILFFFFQKFILFYFIFILF